MARKLLEIVEFKLSYRIGGLSMKKLLTAIVVGFGTLAATQASAMYVEGTINPSSEVDYYQFTSTGGSATFNVLARYWTGIGRRGFQIVVIWRRGGRVIHF